MLVERCYECHSASAKKIKAGLRLDSRDGLLKGGESGQPAIIPGDAEQSQLIRALRWTDDKLQMPPKKKLSDAHIADFVAWINSGAPFPDSASRASRPSSLASVKHWAFQPPKEPLVPKVKDKRWPRTPVDSFILAKLEANGFKPSPPADRRTLIRRASYGLVGLPPTQAEVDAFIADTSDEAFEHVVDRLLASPRYGERWGRYWLDVARYSDTKGYVYAREERFWVHAHAYRDWVIRAVNDDLPYDRFLLLQLAADQAALDDLAAQAAMGFLTVGRRFLGVTHDVIDDRIDAVSRGMLGLTVACARCHDHKYDPIPTADYYSLYGVFHNSVEKFICLDPSPARTDAYAAFDKEYQTRAKKLADSMLAEREKAASRVRARAGEYLAAQLDLSRFPEEGFDQILTDKDLIPASVRRWRDFLQQRGAGFDPVFQPWHALQQLPAGQFEKRAQSVLDALNRSSGPKLNPLVAAAFATAPTNMTEVGARYGKLFGDVEKSWKEFSKSATNPVQSAIALPDPAAEEFRLILFGSDSPCVVPDTGIVNNEQFFETGVCEALWKLQGEVDRWLIRTPAAPPHALVLNDAAPEPNPHILKRGNPATKGDEVPRQFLAVLAGPQRKPFAHGSGRLELAQAIASPQNPLTARVAVNRVWLHHFGTGLVRTPSDFGRRAETPSHPELLDWLALRFIADGWSLKKLHRLIMLSAVYQQSSDTALAASDRRTSSGDAHKVPLQILDPDNRLLSSFPRQRLDFEALRDSLLFVSGELDMRMGGKPVELFKPPFTARRTVYGLVDRQFVPATLRVFDFANPDMHNPQRAATTVPQQSLYLLNSPFAADRARALVARTDIASLTRADDRVRALYRVIYQREPTPAQLAAALAFVNTSENEPAALPTKILSTAWQYGFGEVDEAAGRVKNFTPLPYFTGDAWQGGADWPDAKLGWVRLTAEGGHAGNDLQHAAVRRWVAPVSGAISITGTVRHEFTQGDGIRAFVVSSRHGLLGLWTLHNSQADAGLARVTVEAGDTLDFVVDFRANLNSDEFKWMPALKVVEAAGEPAEWTAKKDFAGPLPAPLKPLTPLERYAQVLLLANEFMFVD
ncbi:MAG: PSD1 domain-containing protein [Verrucomicrobia bacterium]|nr:PSD1 domain-containing protein [Verrucomicrobiota bacterium]